LARSDEARHANGRIGPVPTRPGEVDRPTVQGPRPFDGGLMSDNISTNYRPSEDEPYMNPRQTEYFRRKLLRCSISALTAGRALCASVMVASPLREVVRIAAAFKSARASASVRALTRFLIV
jgi:hypothetical protein